MLKGIEDLWLFYDNQIHIVDKHYEYDKRWEMRYSWMIDEGREVVFARVIRAIWREVRNGSGFDRVNEWDDRLIISLYWLW